MLGHGSMRRRTFVAATVALGTAAILTSVIVAKQSWYGLAPRVVGAPYKSKAQVTASDSAVAPYDSETRLADPVARATPKHVDPVANNRPVPVATNVPVPVTATGQVSGELFVRDLARAGQFSEHEQSRVRSFLEFIARAQGQVSRVEDPEHQADLARRLQKQALNGIQIRVANEKREHVAKLLENGVPLLAFEGTSAP